MGKQLSTRRDFIKQTAYGLCAVNVGLARTFRPMGQTEQAELLDKTRDAASTGEFEPFKTPPNFDGPVGRKLMGLVDTIIYPNLPKGSVFSTSK